MFIMPLRHFRQALTALALEANRAVPRSITYVEGEDDSRDVSSAELYERALGILYHLQRMGARRGDKLVVDAESWAEIPHPLAARVARIALAEAGCDPRRISSKHVAGVLALTAAASGSCLDLPGPTGARRRGRLVEFGPCVFPTKS
jgi:hypothetical protein